MCREAQCPNTSGDLCPSCSQELSDWIDEQAEKDREWRELFASNVYDQPCADCGQPMDSMHETAEGDYRCSACAEKAICRTYELR